jgi:hypothetical protein
MKMGAGEDRRGKHDEGTREKRVCEGRVRGACTKRVQGAFMSTFPPKKSLKMSPAPLNLNPS